MLKSLQEFYDQYARVTACLRPSVQILLLTELHYEFNQSNLTDQRFSAMLESTRANTVEELIRNTGWSQTTFTFAQLEQAFIPDKYQLKQVVTIARTLLRQHDITATYILNNALRRNTTASAEDQAETICTLYMRTTESRYYNPYKYINAANHTAVTTKLITALPYTKTTGRHHLFRDLIKLGCEVTCCDGCNQLFTTAFFPMHIAISNKTHLSTDQYQELPLDIQCSINAAQADITSHNNRSLSHSLAKQQLHLTADDLSNIIDESQHISADTCQQLAKYTKKQKWYAAAVKLLKLAVHKSHGNYQQLLTVLSDFFSLPTKQQDAEALTEITAKIEQITPGKTAAAKYALLFDRSDNNRQLCRYWARNLIGALYHNPQDLEPDNIVLPYSKIQTLITALTQKFFNAYNAPGDERPEPYLQALHQMMLVYEYNHRLSYHQIFSDINSTIDLRSILTPVVATLARMDCLGHLKQIVGDLHNPEDRSSFNYAQTIFNLLAWQSQPSRKSLKHANYWLNQIQPDPDFRLKQMSLLLKTANSTTSAINASHYINRFTRAFCPKASRLFFNPKALKTYGSNTTITTDFVAALYLFKWRNGYKLPPKFTTFKYAASLTSICSAIINLLFNNKVLNDETVSFIGEHLAFIHDATFVAICNKLRTQPDPFTALEHVYYLQRHGRIATARMSQGGTNFITKLNSMNYRDLQQEGIDIFINYKLTTAITKMLNIDKRYSRLVREPIKLTNYLRGDERHTDLVKMYEHDLAPLPTTIQERAQITDIDCQKIDKAIVIASLQRQAQRNPSWATANHAWFSKITGQRITNIYHHTKICDQTNNSLNLKTSNHEAIELNDCEIQPERGSNITIEAQDSTNIQHWSPTDQSVRV